MEKDKNVEIDDENIDMSKYIIFKEYMQSLSNVSEADLQTNKTILALCRKKRAYWDKQPVMVPDTIKEKKEENEKNQEVIKPKALIEQVRNETPKDMVELMEQYEWDSCNFSNEEILDEVQSFLDKNYVESKTGDFRFSYSKKMLRWALTPPGYDKDFMIAMRIKTSKKMVGFISGIVCDIKSENVEKKMIEINFLCVDKIFRTKNFAPL